MKKYSKEFKDSTVQLIINNNESVSQIAKDLDIHPKSLYAWVTAYKKEHNMTVLQPARYNEILDKRGAQGSLCGMSPEFAAKVFESIHEESVRQQMEIINK